MLGRAWSDIEPVHFGNIRQKMGGVVLSINSCLYQHPKVFHFFYLPQGRTCVIQSFEAPISMEKNDRWPVCAIFWLFASIVFPGFLQVLLAIFDQINSRFYVLSRSLWKTHSFFACLPGLSFHELGGQNQR